MHVLEHSHSFLFHTITHCWQDVAGAYVVNQWIILSTESGHFGSHSISEIVYAVACKELIEHIHRADVPLVHPELVEVYAKARGHVYDTSHFVSHSGVCGCHH